MPWPWIVGLVLAAFAAAWLGSQIRIEFPSAADPPPRAAETVDVEVVEPIGPPPPPVPVSGDAAQPRWALQPVVEYPEMTEAPAEARVVVNCAVQGDRSLGDCRIVSETPPGRGFGRSTIEGARKARVAGDQAIGQRVQFTVRYLPPE